MQRKGTAKALQILQVAIDNMETAQTQRLETRAKLERYSTAMFWRSVEALCERTEKV